MEILLYTKLKWSVSAEYLQFYFNFVYSNISNFTIKDFNNHWQWNKFWKASTFNNFMLIVLFYQGLFFVTHFAVPRSPLSLWEWSRGGVGVYHVGSPTWGEPCNFEFKALTHCVTLSILTFLTPNLIQCLRVICN